jgi:hypothetical protein
MHRKADRRGRTARRSSDAASIERVIETLQIALRQLEEHDNEYHHRTPTTVYGRIKHLIGCLKDPLTVAREDVAPGGLTLLEQRRDKYRAHAAACHEARCYKDEAVAQLSASVMSEAICILKGIDPMEGI